LLGRGSRKVTRREALNRPRTRRRPRPRFVSAAVAIIARSTTSEIPDVKPWHRGKVLEDDDENDSWRFAPFSRTPTRPNAATPIRLFLAPGSYFLHHPLVRLDLFGNLRIQLVLDRVCSRANRILDR